jgi:hypothetical protein
MHDGRVQFPKSAPYIDSLFAEFATFPNGKYDDQVDSVTQLVAYAGRALMFARQKHRPSAPGCPHPESRPVIPENYIRTDSPCLPFWSWAMVAGS